MNLNSIKYRLKFFYDKIPFSIRKNTTYLVSFFSSIFVLDKLLQLISLGISNRVIDMIREIIFIIYNVVFYNLINLIQSMLNVPEQIAYIIYFIVLFSISFVTRNEKQNFFCAILIILVISLV